MDRTPVTSSLIASLGHDPEIEEMHVEFKSGKVYAYANVSADKFAEIRDAGSVGVAFQEIKRNPGAYPFREVVAS